MTMSMLLAVLVSRCCALWSISVKGGRSSNVLIISAATIGITLAQECYIQRAVLHQSVWILVLYFCHTCSLPCSRLLAYASDHCLPVLAIHWPVNLFASWLLEDPVPFWVNSADVPMARVVVARLV